jgi:hypothetical protein
VSAGAIRTRLDGSGFELRRSLSESKKRASYQSAQDMSHTDMLHHALFIVKRNDEEMQFGSTLLLQ